MDNQYLADFQYVGSRIKNCKIKNDFISFADSKEMKRSLKVTHKVISVGNIENDKTFLGVIELNIIVSISSEKQKYVISLSIEGCFEAPLDMGEEDFRTMLQINGITTLYSIARGFIQSTTSQTLIDGTILLPMFNVAAYSKDIGKKSTNDEEETVHH